MEKIEDDMMDDDSPAAGLHILTNQNHLLNTFLPLFFLFFVWLRPVYGYLLFTVHICSTNVSIEIIRNSLSLLCHKRKYLTHKAKATDGETNRNTFANIRSMQSICVSVVVVH